MARFNIENFKSKFTGGARPYLFYFIPQFPAIAAGGINVEDVQYLVKSSSLPQTSMEDLTVAWQGHDFKMAGKHTFDDFTITFNVDKDANIIRKYQSWLNAIRNPGTNEHAHIDDYMIDQTMVLLDYADVEDADGVIRYKLHHAYPKTVGAIELAYDSTEVASVEVTFSYQYHSII